MSRPTSAAAKPLTLAERKARLAALVASGKVSAKAAELIDLREPTPEVIAHAQTLKERVRKARSRNGRIAA